MAVEALDGDELRAAFPAFGPGVLGGRVLGRRLDRRCRGRHPCLRRGGAGAGAAIRTGVRAAQVRTAGGRVTGVLTDAGPRGGRRRRRRHGPVARPSCSPSCRVRAGRGWLMRTNAWPSTVPWIVEEVSWPDQRVLGEAARPVALADLAAGRIDEPIGECFLICPLPGGTR